jgi:hypothetical protein
VSDEEPRPWTMETGAGRVDADGVEWFTCDPYPTWYRYDANHRLITRTAPRFLE